MATVYQIQHTDGVRTITIQPGTLNGPGGVLSNTDLQLYGQGTLEWGQGVDQNLLRLTENFAAPESVITPGSPMGETEIGVPQAGINNPIAGQQWFNTTDLSMYAYDGSGWKLVGGVFTAALPPSGPAAGDLWYDTSVPQLKVYDGAAFVSVADRYLLLTGGAMASGASITLSGGGEIFGLPTSPTAPDSAASRQYVDNQISLVTGGATLDFVNITGDTMTGDLTIQKSTPILTINANSGTDASVRFREAGTDRGDLIVSQTSDDIILRRKTGATVTNQIRLRSSYIETDSSTGKIRTPATVSGDNSLTVTTKGYVDTEITAATAGLGGNLSEIFEQTGDPGGAAKNGDIWLDTNDVPSVYIKMNGVFRKVFPAQYTA